MRKIAWTENLATTYHDGPIFTESTMSTDTQADHRQPESGPGILPLIVGVVVYSVVLCVSYL